MRNTWTALTLQTNGRNGADSTAAAEAPAERAAAPPCASLGLPASTARALQALTPGVHLLYHRLYGHLVEARPDLLHHVVDFVAGDLARLMLVEALEHPLQHWQEDEKGSPPQTRKQRDTNTSLTLSSGGLGFEPPSCTLLHLLLTWDLVRSSTCNQNQRESLAESWQGGSHTRRERGPFPGCGAFSARNSPW